MINYIEKGYGLHEKIKEMGYFICETNGAWESSDDSVVQSIIDNYSVEDAKEYMFGVIDYLSNEYAKENPLKIMSIMEWVNDKKEIVGLLNEFDLINNVDLSDLNEV